MSYGIEVTNPLTGKLLISESYSSYHFVGNAVFQSGRLWRINTGVGGDAYRPIVFVVAGAAYTTVESIHESSAGVWDISVRTSAATPSRVLVFQPLTAVAPLEPWGIQVLRTGYPQTVAFDSTRKPLYLRTVHDLSGYDTSGSIDGVSVATPALTTPAVFCASPGVTRKTNYGALSDIYSEAVLAARVQGSQLQYAFTTIYTFSAAHDPLEESGWVDNLEDTVTNSLVSVIDASIY